MNQSRLGSLIEVNINIASGFFVSLALWTWIVAPLYNIPVTMADNLGITGIFTVSAIIRGYFWRRFFNGPVHQLVKKYTRDA